MTNKKIERVLIVGPAWVGDMVMAQSLFIYLRQKNSKIIIDVLAPEWSIELIKRMPEVRTAISLPIKHGKLSLMLRYKIGVKLRNNNYDQAIVTPRSFKAALIPFFAKIPIRTGYRGEMRYGLINDIRPLNKDILTKTVQRYIYLGNSIEQQNIIAKINYPQLKISKSEIEQLTQRLSLNLDKPIIALLPGAEYGPAKQWPIESYSELANRLYDKGYQVWVLGSEKDKQNATKILNKRCDEFVNLCGKTNIVNTIDLLSLVTYAITNDSGLMHIACATNVSVIAIYGSSSPSYTPPLHLEANIVYKNLDCSPCFKRECQFKHTNCLKKISVDEVLKYVN